MRRWIVVASVVILTAAGIGVYELHYRTDHRSTPIGVDVAVQDFQVSAASVSVPDDALAPQLPALGVYSYTTTGNDGVDALGGASHSYPSTTTITVTAAGCGVAQRWAPIEQRFDETITCATDGGIELRQFTAFHQFFGQDERERYTCSGDPRPLGATAGTTWTVACTKETGTEDVGVVSTWTGTVVGTESLRVGDDDVEVEHVTVAIDNQHPGDVQLIDTWYLAGTDLVVRSVVNNSSSSDSPLGKVHYLEHVELTLDSLTPAR